MRPHTLLLTALLALSLTEGAAQKLVQRNHGLILGLQRGRSTFLEFGGEAHWRTFALRHPRIWGASLNIGYNIGDNVIGYTAGGWMKHGRINFTYGGTVAYFSDFDGASKFGIGPQIGFRVLGFHIINGYQLLLGTDDFKTPNPVHITLRYYFPLKNKFEWEGRKKSGARSRERDRPTLRERLGL